MLRAEITELLPGCCTFVPVEEIKRILTRPGFVEVLLERYRDAAASGTPKSQSAIFYELEAEYWAEYKRPLYWNFDAYKMYKSRHKNEY